MSGEQLNLQIAFYQIFHRNIDKDMAWLLPLLVDKAGMIKAQMEDKDDGGEEEDGEEVMKVLFGEEEDEETDIESNGEEVKVFELF